MLETRIITAVVLLVGFMATLFLASVDVFALVLSFVVAASAWEWSRLCGLSSENGQTVYAALVGLFVLICLYIPYSESLLQWLLLADVLFWVSAPMIFYLAPRHVPIDRLDPVLAGLGVLLFLGTAIAAQYLRSFAPQGSSWLLLYAFAVVWCMDIGAYFIGRRFGRQKLAPSISPGKTREGVYGGLAATGVLMVVVMLSADWAAGSHLKLLLATVLAAGVSVVGDLYESRIKRAAGVKDSSQMLPGHGGVLDRIDGILAAIPVFAFAWAWL